jgi:hypothetical protein
MGISHKVVDHFIFGLWKETQIKWNEFEMYESFIKESHWYKIWNGYIYDDFI